MVKKWILKKTNLGLKLSTLDYLSLEVYENISLYFTLFFDQLVKCGHTSNQAGNFFPRLFSTRKRIICGCVSELEISSFHVELT